MSRSPPTCCRRLPWWCRCISRSARSARSTPSSASRIIYLSILAPFTAWLLKSNFDNVPFEIEQAAMMDGANLWQIMRNVTLPLAAPGLTTAGLFAFLLAWDEFFYALLFTSDQRAKTLTVAIADLAGGRIADYGLIAAAGIIAALPPVIIGFGLQKALISGLTTGGVKG